MTGNADSTPGLFSAAIDSNHGIAITEWNMALELTPLDTNLLTKYTKGKLLLSKSTQFIA